MARRVGTSVSMCASYQKLGLRLVWSNLFYSLYSLPDPLNPALKVPINNYVRHQLISSLALDFPESVITRKALEDQSSTVRAI